MTRRRGLALALLAALAAGLGMGLLGLAACAKREPPSGGPPDITPPRLVRTFPDSGRAGVPTHTRVTLTFDETMEPRATAAAVQIAPPVPIRQRHWHGRTLTLEFEDTLLAHHTYTVFVGATARDRHGNDMVSGASIVFSTAAEFPRGRIEGDLEAKGFSGPGTSLWCYDASRTGVPDSTARDFDALGLVDEKGHFRVDGLAVPGRYRLWAFADLNANRSYEPDRDVLAAIDTTFELTDSAFVAGPFALQMVNRRAPSTVEGTVLDSLRDSLGVTRVLAVSEADSTLRGLSDLDRDGVFQISLMSGVWILRAFQDEDRDGAWQPAREPYGDTLRVVLAPADHLRDLKLLLPRRAGSR